MTTKKPEGEKQLAPQYLCTACGKRKKREQLTVKKVLFQHFGRNGQVLRSRVSAWLCEECKNKDIDWNREPSKGGIPRPPIINKKDGK